jgi:ArsR family transcriptional regulator
VDFCCTPLYGRILEEDEAADLAAALSALADPVRLRIVSMLAAAPEGTACGCDLEGPLGLSQPTVSHHLKILRQSGIIRGRKEGRWVHYSLVPDRLQDLRSALDPEVVVMA